MTLRQMIGFFDREQAQRGFDQVNWEKLRQNLQEFRDGEFNRTVLMSVRLGGTGDVTKTHVIWHESRGVPEVPSPLVYRDRIYLVRNGGLLVCREAATGKMIYDERLGAEGGYYASPLGADGRVYVASDRGTISVVAAGDQFSVLARNDLGEAVFASPAVVKDTLYVRSTHHLWAFGR